MTTATARRAFDQGTASARALRRIELTVSRRLDGILQGDHSGQSIGPGWDTAEGRPYEPGDDVRRIDWNLTARSDGPQVRDTVADRELDAWFVIDGSASLDFGTATHEKRDLALAGVAALSHLIGGPGDRIGALIVEPGDLRIVPPQPGRIASHHLLRVLLSRPPAAPGGPVLEDALRKAANLARRRGLVVVVSDLLEPPDRWAGPLRLLAARHDVVVVEVRDPREDRLPAVGLLTLVDPETGRLREVQSSSSKLQARFAAAADQRRADVAQVVRSAGAAHLPLSTDRDWVVDVARFARSRRRRR